MRDPQSSRSWFALTLVLMIAVLPVVTVAQNVPQAIRFNGNAVDTNNHPVKGTAGALFAIYTQR